MSFPSRRHYNSIDEWADAVERYMSEEASMTPTPVLLAKKTATDKAVLNGALLFDTSTNRVVVSIGGAWKRLKTQDDT